MDRLTWSRAINPCQSYSYAALGDWLIAGVYSIPAYRNDLRGGVADALREREYSGGARRVNRYKGLQIGEEPPPPVKDLILRQ